MEAPKVSIKAILLLVLMALLAGGAASRETATIDEIAHLGAGVSYLERLDMRLNEEHPPLAKVLAAIPLLVRGIHADYSTYSWTYSGQKLFNQYLGEWVFGHWLLLRWNDPYSTLRWARLPMLGATLLLGFFLYRFGSRLGGTSWGGLLCLTVFATMPVFLAFGPLVITDIVVTLFWLLTVWQLPAMWRSPDRAQVIRFGLALGGALLSKFSSGLLFLVFPAVALSVRLHPLAGQPGDKAELRSWRSAAWRNLGKGVLWAALFVYVAYLILSWNQPTDSFNAIHFPASPVLRRMLMPVWIYLRGLIGFAVTAASRPTYILGHAYPHGVWFYFPVLVILKSPLPFLLLLLAAAVLRTMLKFRVPQASAIAPGMEFHWRSIWISGVVFTAACLLNRLDISIRHFSIPLALMILMLAPLPRMLELVRQAKWEGSAAAAWATKLLAAASVVTAIAAYPNYFPFINLLGMGRPGYMLVNDSNLDWNQALSEVRRFARARNLPRILLDAYTLSDPQAYVQEAQLWDCQQPSANDGGEWAVVSANLIMDGSNCSWLLKHLHLELAGGSMYAFLLPRRIPPAGSPGGPPLPKDYRYFGGIPVAGEDARRVFLRCIRDPHQLEPTMDRLASAPISQSKDQIKK
ncbi:MAG: glycosyltransferase family 39 protein [Acidobacteria bacterium]|nr:glycosyltransferase family 39 protein [Acidobacteriota bacterium]